MLAIDAKNVTKLYGGSHFPALKEISIQVRTGQIFTLLGHNDAGKTIFVRICATQLMPTSGDIEILGFDASIRLGNLDD
jgi:ABC-2 type transport system ATP-binding protein